MSTTTTSDIKSKASAFSQSYGRAMEMGFNPDCSREECANALTSHYSPSFMSFTFGGPGMKLQDTWPGATQSAVVAKHLENYDKAGFGWRIRLLKHEVYEYSAGSAQCWLIWEIEPKTGEGWQWTNIYAFRLPMDDKGKLAEEGFWEYSVADNEIGALLQRCPNFWQL